MYLRQEVPNFNSRVIAFGFPSDAEFPDVLSALREHTDLLDKAADQVWKTRHTLPSGGN